MSQLTTHILDISKGIPAKLIVVTLFQEVAGESIEIAKGITNSDGRVGDLLMEGDLLPLGTYRLKFDVKPYFEMMEIKAFYPHVEIVFCVNSAEHYHVPLLLSPFGYSTYRGS